MALTHQPKHKQTIHDKKRVGQHHKPNKHYTKTYWPYLPMLLVVVVGFVINTTWNVGKGVLGYATEMSATALLQETNVQRSANGRSALSINNLLNQAAQAKANDMASRNYWSHTTPDGKQPWQFISDVGYTYTTAGENLAYGFDTSAYTVAGWMNSPPHKENLLNAGYTEVGFGIANAASYQGAGEQTIVVAMYAKPQIVVTPNSAQTGRAPETTTPTPAPTKPAEEAPAPEPQQETAAEPEETKQPETAQDTTTTEEPAAQPLPTREVSRIDVLTSGNAQWAALAVSVLATVAAIAFIIKHTRAWRRYLIKGEDFLIKHPLLDIGVLAVCVLAIILTQTSGFIH